ncbi:MAG TPA: VPLPA-CTERM sorting domain-containing protein [Spongiibacteraceae bacterium]|nr:VPLPA-CTERM sorting domain-containing protein [Spongiibacteraceae bacterium]
MNKNLDLLRPQTLALLLAATAFTTLQATAAVVPIVDGNGKMTGAKNVVVNGSLYDVEFRDGVFNTLFGEQNQLGFVAPSEAVATDFSQALLDTVLVGQFDDYSYRTLGCEHLAYCMVYTPYLGVPVNTPYPGVWVAAAYNEGLEGGNTPPNDLIMLTAAHRLNDYANNPAVTYALWSPAAVPVPAAAWLFGSGLIALAAARRKLA